MATASAQFTMQSLAAAGRSESVVYRPSAGEARTIEAIVERAGREAARGGAVPRMVVTVVNDATIGITPDEIDSGGDRLDVAEHLGDAAGWLQITEVMAENIDFITLAVR